MSTHQHPDSQNQDLRAQPAVSTEIDECSRVTPTFVKTLLQLGYLPSRPTQPIDTL